jgi:hypothetical protein
MATLNTNRKIVPNLCKSVKQIAKQKWNEAKRQVKAEFNEMVNSVPDVVDQIKEELVDMAEQEVKNIVNSIQPSLQEVSYVCNKGVRLYITWKYATPEQKEEKKKAVIEWMKTQADEFYNGFILLMIKDTLEESVKTFQMLWSAGIEMWQNLSAGYLAIKEMFQDPELADRKKDEYVEKALALINQMLPLILSMIPLIQNYLINHGWCQETGDNHKNSLNNINAVNRGIDPALLPKEKENDSVNKIYKDAIDSSIQDNRFKIDLGDCKLYPSGYVDHYDSSVLGCFVEPSQLLRVVKEDQSNASKFSNSSSGNSIFSADIQGEDSLCYVIPPLNNNIDDIIKRDEKDSSCLHAIIEFDDECCKYPEEPYKWQCLPGEVVFQDKVLAECKQYEKMVPVKSIFKTGIIRKDPCTGDFARIRPDVCNRHIIIDCVEEGAQGILDSSIVEELNDDFKREQNLYDLFYKYMCYATLPSFIVRKSYYKYPAKMLGLIMNPEWISNESHKEATEIYDEYIEHYEKTIDNFKEELLKLNSEDKIKATNAEYEKLKALGDEIIAARKEFVFGTHVKGIPKNGIIDWWEQRDKQSKSKCFKDYSDCRGLAETYYIDLLGMLQFSEEEKDVLDFYKLVESIIYKRENVEGFDWEALKNKVIKLLDEIGSATWEDIFNSYEGPDKFNSVMTKISANVDTNDADLMKKIYRATNLFMALKRRDYYKKVGPSEEEYSNEKIFELVKNEKKQLDDFFYEKMLDYKKVEMSNLIKKAESLAEPQAEWPPALDLTIGGNIYKLYKFANIDAYLNGLNNSGVDNSLEAGIDPNNYEYKEEDVTKKVQAAVGNISPDTINSSDLMPNDCSDKFSGVTDIPFTDIRYWMKYCSIATVVSLPFLATGLVILGVPIPLPAIFLPFTVVKGDVTIVVGLGIRGISFFPMMIYVNGSQDNSTTLVPLLIALKAIKDAFMANMSKIELTIPDVANLIISQLQSNNANLLNQNDQIDKQVAALKSIQKPQWSEIKRQMKRMVHEDTREIVTRLKGK